MLLRAMKRPTRLLALGGLVLAGFLYWKPIGAYMHTKQILQQRQAEVARLQAQNASLDRKSTRLNSSHTDISRMPSSA